MTSVSSNSECLNRAKLSKREQFTLITHPAFFGLLQEFVAKLVLEVFGGGGAMWGFSEVCGLRTKRPESIHFWRSVSITVAALFCLRWLQQIRLAVSLLVQNEQKQYHKVTRGMDSCKSNDSLTIKTEDDDEQTKNSFKSQGREKSPIGIQLSSFLFGRKEEIENDLSPNNLFPDNEVHVFLSSTEDTECTGLTSSPRSPKSQL